MNIPYPLQSAWASRKCASQKTKAELLGLVQGILADGAIVEPEARFLQTWISEHADMREQWPCSVLMSRIDEMLSDGVLDPEEQGELLKRMLDFVALRHASAAIVINVPKGAEPLPAVTLSSPYDDPAPSIEYPGRIFVVTGDFACAKRSDIVSKIESQGGDVASSVSKKVHFLLIGSLGSELWKADGYGTKIEKAIELRNAGAPIRIVAEKHWFESLA
jgi:NAD-dependent DNA ligase